MTGAAPRQGPGRAGATRGPRKDEARNAGARPRRPLRGGPGRSWAALPPRSAACSAVLAALVLAGCAGTPERPAPDGPGLRLRLDDLPQFQAAPDPRPVPRSAPDNVPLLKGDPAPFDGVLVSEAWLINREETADQRDTLKGQVGVLAKLAADLQAEAFEGLTRTAEAARLQWWEEPSTNRWIGFALGVGLTIGAGLAFAEVAGALD